MTSEARGYRRGHTRLLTCVGECRLQAVLEGVMARQEAVRHRDLPAAGYAEFLAQHVAVGFRRSGGDAEAFADLLVRAAGRNEFDHLSLTGRDIGV